VALDRSTRSTCRTQRDDHPRRRLADACCLHPNRPF
jgi:hypothetical protein